LFHSFTIDPEISIDVVEMIEFKGLSLSMIRNMSEEGGNGTLVRNQISFPSSLLRDALKDKLASGEQAGLLQLCHCIAHRMASKEN